MQPAIRDETTPLAARVSAPATYAAVWVSVAVALAANGSGRLAAVVAVVALVGGLVGRRGSAKPSSIMSAYIGVIILYLASASTRHLAGETDALGAFVPAVVRGPGPDSAWFIAFVVIPVAVMLYGGYLVGRRKPAAATMVWWTVAATAADGLWGLSLAIKTPASGWSILSIAAALAQLGLSTVLARRMLTSRSRTAELQPALTDRRRNLWTGLIVCMVALYALSIYTTAGLLPVGVIIGAMMGGLIAWRRTTSRRPANPNVHVPLYLLMLSLFTVHLGEEALTGFNRAIGQLTSHQWGDQPFTLIFGLLGPIVWVLGAWSLWSRQAFGNFIYWFMIVGMIVGEPTHVIVFPVARAIQMGNGYHYFSGMYTALLPMIPAFVSLLTLVHEHRTKTSPGEPPVNVASVGA